MSQAHWNQSWSWKLRDRLHRNSDRNSFSFLYWLFCSGQNVPINSHKHYVFHLNQPQCLYNTFMISIVALYTCIRYPWGNYLVALHDSVWISELEVLLRLIIMNSIFIPQMYLVLWTLSMQPFLFEFLKLDCHWETLLLTYISGISTASNACLSNCIHSRMSDG